MKHIITLMIRKKTECNAFISVYTFPFWSFCWEEWKWLPWQNNNLGLTGGWLFLWKKKIKKMFCKDVSQCVQRRREFYFLSHLHPCNSRVLAAQTILMFFELPSCFSQNLAWWRLLKPDIKGWRCRRIPHCFLLPTVL